ncbi:MAG: ABC-F family ATP-binding cassette domain-containing protein [Myxococcota bacterium]
MIRLDDLTVAPGGNELVRGATFHLRPGDHVGLIGRNGTGKTTILRTIVGELSPDHGRVEVRPQIRLGWLPQQAVSGSSLPVWDEVRSRMTRINALRSELEAAQRAVEADPNAAERLARATERFRLEGGFSADERIGEVLHGLGFAPADWRRTCDTFSGGWQMRIALARLLLSEPDVALLDEPTNHLDLEARSFLARFLAEAPWAFVLVSHDRWLLDRCVNRIAEIRNSRLHTYVGNFSAFLVERESRALAEERAYDQQQKQVAHLQSFVDRFGAKATKAAAAKSKQKALDRIERVDAPEGENKKSARIRFPPAPAGAMEAVGLVDASVGWDAEHVVLEHVTLPLDRGTRVVLLGPNGCGKSTILQTLAGRLPTLAGRRRIGDRVRIGAFDQDLAQALPKDVSALDHLTTECPTVLPQQIRTVLGALGLPGALALRPIGELSGGEKARVALALLVVRPCNVLLLDEPTNHLDAETVDVLVGALQEFDGALLLVSHDRFVVERVATHAARIRDGKLELREGIRPEDFERDPPAGGGAGGVTVQAAGHADRKKRQRELERGKRRLGEIEVAIPRAEAAVARVDQALIDAATDHAKVMALARDRDAAQAVVDGLYAEWEQLEQLLAEG